MTSPLQLAVLHIIILYSPGCVECTTSPCTITGLNPNTEYEFTVTLNSVTCGTYMNTAEIGTLCILHTCMYIYYVLIQYYISFCMYSVLLPMKLFSNEMKMGCICVHLSCTHAPKHAHTHIYTHTHTHTQIHMHKDIIYILFTCVYRMSSLMKLYSSKDIRMG